MAETEKASLGETSIEKGEGVGVFEGALDRWLDRGGGLESRPGGGGEEEEEEERREEGKGGSL